MSGKGSRTASGHTLASYTLPQQSLLPVSPPILPQKKVFIKPHLWRGKPSEPPPVVSKQKHAPGILPGAYLIPLQGR